MTPKQRQERDLQMQRDWTRAHLALKDAKLVLKQLQGHEEDLVEAQRRITVALHEIRKVKAGVRDAVKTMDEMRRTYREQRGKWYELVKGDMQ